MGMSETPPLKSKSLTILIHEWVTGGGMAGEDLPASWAAEGNAMRRAIATDFASLPDVRVVMTLDHRLPNEPGPWTVTRIGPGPTADAWVRLAADADWTVLIAPETGGVLADCSRTLVARGGRTLGASPEAIELTGDKARLGAYLSARGIPTPESRCVVPAHGLPADAPYPAVLKPIDGAGSTETYWIADSQSTPAAAASTTPALLLPYVAGIPASASFLVDRDGRAELIAVGRQRVEIEDGRFVYSGGILPDPAHETEFVPILARAVEAVPSLRGFVGIDFVRGVNESGDEIVTILEINPRATTSYVGLARLLPPGRLARAWIDAVTGTAVEGADSLADLIRTHAPVTFDADGTFSIPVATNGTIGSDRAAEARTARSVP